MLQVGTSERGRLCGVQNSSCMLPNACQPTKTVVLLPLGEDCNISLSKYKSKVAEVSARRFLARLKPNDCKGQLLPSPAPKVFSKIVAPTSEDHHKADWAKRLTDAITFL